MRWCLFKEKLRGQEKWVIRRRENGRNKRLPISKYRQYRNDEDALRSFVKRLNAGIDLKKKVEYRHSFYNDSLLEDFRTYLLNRVAVEKTAKQEFSYFKRHCGGFFVDQLGLSDPADWFNVSDTKWASYLLSSKAPRSAKSKRDIVNSGNKFLAWLRQKRPGEIPDRKLEPLTKGKLFHIEDQRKKNNQHRKQKLIPDRDLEIICRCMPKEIRAAVNLCAKYGLRRNESLGVKSGDVRKESLYIERQLVKIGEYGPTKGKQPRKVPHWKAKATEAYTWVEEVQLNPLHPRTFNSFWDKAIRHLKYNSDESNRISDVFTPHDMRHTWITRMVRIKELLDVSIAAGHKDQRITQKYKKDDRELDDAVFIPEGA